MRKLKYLFWYIEHKRLLFMINRWAYPAYFFESIMGLLNLKLFLRLSMFCYTKSIKLKLSKADKEILESDVGLNWQLKKLKKDFGYDPTQ